MNKIIVILFLICIFQIFFLPVKDTDFGWHYRCGHEVLAGNASCLYQNTYTYYVDGYQWAYPRLVYDTVLSFVFDHFGLIGVSVLGATMMTVAFGLVLFAYSGPSVLKAIAISLSVFGGWSVYSLGYRSQIVSIFFLAIEIFILKKSFKNPRLLWFLPVLFAIWTNTHPGFFLGPLIMGLYIISGTKSPVNISILAISCLVTLMNPYGWRVYEEVLRHLFTPLNTLIAEWVAPGIDQIAVIAGSIIFLTTVQIKQRIKPGYLFFLASIFGYMAISARRNLPLYYFVVPVAFLEIIPRFSIKKTTLKFINILGVSVLQVVCLILFGNVARAVNFNSQQKTYCENGLIVFPCQAVDYFRDRSGNVFNTYEWGGFLIWKLPNMKFFVDGRMPAWPTNEKKSPYTVFLEIIQARPSWNKTLEKYNTDYILIAPGTFLDLALDKNKALQFGWKEEYRDKTAVIYRKI